jgi:hypothetical protein
MKWLANVLAHIGLAACAAIACMAGARAEVPLLPLCSWPIEFAGEGVLNIATPDTRTTYWFMPVDTRLWKSITFQGIYPNARAFNFTSYTESGVFISTLADDQIKPDPGSTNPFATPEANGSRFYTVTISASGSGPNKLDVGGSRLVFILYRVIVPNQGLDKSGGTGLPAVTLAARAGGSLRLRPCPFANAQAALGNTIPILVASGFSGGAGFLQTILAAVNQKNAIQPACAPGQAPASAAVPFGPAPGLEFYPNPPTSYLQTPNVCFQPGRILVLRGRALVYPNTYLGSSIFEPAFDEQVEARYWSMCNNDGVFPYPVLGCQADYETRLDQTQSYTYVVSADPGPPSWLPADATWLPWGPPEIPITVIFRAILAGNVPVPAEFTPKGAICDEALFMAQGWQGCFAAAGVSSP